MRFSIARLLIATVLVNIILCLSYAAPVWIGFPALSFLSLIIIPPMIIVGVFNTRGARQAFFLGCMLSGIMHWVVSLYMAVMVAMSSFDGSGMSDLLAADELGIFRSFHIIGYVIGIIGGLSGVGMYFFVTSDPTQAVKKEPPAEENVQANEFNREEQPAAELEELELGTPQKPK